MGGNAPDRKDSRTHILFLIPSLQGGGSERVIVSLLRHLDRNRFRLVLAVVDSRHARYRADVPDDIEFIDLECSRVRQAIPKIIKLVWNRKPDVVFSTLGHLNLAISIVRPLLPSGVRFIARESIIVSLLPSAYAVPFWWGWAYRRFYGRFDTVICQSKEMRDDLIENFGLAAEKTVVINNPVDVERVRQLAADPVTTGMTEQGRDADSHIALVAAGRLTAQKGFDLLIEALTLCKDPHLRLTVLGEGPMREELERLTIEHGLASQVRFVGFQKNPYPFMAKADAFVLSSRFEGSPNVVLEALACGTPVIATPAPGGVREILERLDGCVLAEKVSARSLANALTGFRGRYRMPSTAVASHGIESIVKRYEQVLLGNVPAE